MKFLLTALLLVHTVQSIVDGTGFSRGACLQTINSARAAFAEKLQVANMNSLNYNKRLEPAILKQLSFVDGCPEPSIISHKNLDIYLNVRGQEDLIVELLSGTDNTVLACVKSKCNGKPIVSIVTDVSDSVPIAGAPGTECSSDRFAMSNGLCALKKEHSRRNWSSLFGTLKQGYYAAKSLVKKKVVDPVVEAAEKIGEELSG